MSDRTCQALIRSGSVWSRHNYLCGKRAKVERNGKHYCGTHDPQRLDSRRIAREREDRANSSVRLAGHNVRGAEQTLAEVVASYGGELPAPIASARQYLLDQRNGLRSALAELRNLTPAKAQLSNSDSNPALTGGERQ